MIDVIKPLTQQRPVGIPGAGDNIQQIQRSLDYKSVAMELPTNHLSRSSTDTARGAQFLHTVRGITGLVAKLNCI